MAFFRCGGQGASGDAVAADVLLNKTFSNDDDTDVVGTMPNNGKVTPSGLNCGGSYTIPAGYHNGQGVVTANSLASQTTVDSGKTAVGAGQMVSGYQGWVNGNKISGTFTGQEKSATPSTSSQNITPDSGKYLTKVTVSAISTQEKSTTPTTRSATAATVTPDSGKYLSKVTVNTTSVPNTNSGTKTITSSDTNWISGNVDMGATNTYRYVNAVNVYNKGKADGQANSKVVLDSLDVYCVTTAAFRFSKNVKSITVKPAVAASVRLYTDQGGTIIKQDALPANIQTTITYDSYDGKYIWISGPGLEHLYNIKIEVK